MQVNRACQRCAKRKAKCDGLEPCRRCINSNNSCLYSEAKKRGPKRKVITTNLNSYASSDNTNPTLVNTLARSTAADYLIPHSFQNHLIDLCQAFITASWPIIYTPSLPSLSSLQEDRPVLYSALLLSSTAISSESPDGGFSSVPATPSNLSGIGAARDTLIRKFEAHIDAQGGLKCTEPNLATIQALLFVTSYYVGAGKITIAWNHCGLACRMALSISLHQSCRSSGKKQKSRMEEQEERRTFWGLYVMEQVVSYLLRLPPLLRAEDADRELPDLDERDEYEIWLNERSSTFINTSQAKAMIGVRTHALSSMMAWVQVMKEHESIRKDLKRDLPSGTGAFERLYRERSQRLQAFKDELPAHLQWHSPFVDNQAAYSKMEEFDFRFSLALDSHGGVAPQVLMMRAWYSECCILLHRPCVGEGAEGSYSARRCLCAATEVCVIVTAYERAFGIEVMQFGFIHIIFQSATLLAAMESVYQIFGPNFWNPPLPAIPIATLFDKCFTWLEHLSIRMPFANHYLSILASLSRAQAQSWSRPSTEIFNKEPLRSSELPQSMTTTSSSSFSSSTATAMTTQNQHQPSFNLARHPPPAAPQQDPTLLPDDFWNIVPFDGDDLNGWLSEIESYVPM